MINKNSRINDLPMVKVGHSQIDGARRGVTVIVFDESSPAGVAVFGGAPGSAETDLLREGSLVNGIDALCFSGGSAFGLAAGGGVRNFLSGHDRGFNTGNIKIPIVPTAVIFDLHDDVDRLPTEANGFEAAQNAIHKNSRATGRVGAGSGATVAKYAGITKAQSGGLSSRSIQIGSVTIGVLLVVNAYGAIVGADGSLLSAPADEGGEPVGFNDKQWAPPDFGNTTIGLIVTNAKLDKGDLKRLAIMAGAGLARSINPAFTLFDGDMLFAVSTGDQQIDITKAGSVAAELVAESVRDISTF